MRLTSVTGTRVQQRSVGTIREDRCLREMGTPQFGDGGGGGGGGGHITKDMGTRGLQNSGDMGILQ